MKPHDAAVGEILKGLEGLEMLTQWQQSLVRDLRTKTETLLESIQACPPPPPDRPAQTS